MKLLDIAMSLFNRTPSSSVSKIVGSTPSQHAVRGLTGIYSRERGAGMSKGIAESTVGYLKNNQKQKNASLASISRLSVMDPIGIYGADLKLYDGMTDVMQMALNTITGYVLRAIPFLSDKSRHDVVKVLSQLSPSSPLSIEELKYRLDDPSLYEFGLPTMSTEAVSHYGISSKGSRRGSNRKAKAARVAREVIKRREKNRSRRARITGGDKGLKDANDYTVGKSLQIEIPLSDSDDSTISVNMQVILTARYAPYEVLKNIGKGGSPERGWYEQWLKFRSGSTSLAGLITQGDIVSQDIKAARADKTGITKEIQRRKTHGKIATSFGGEVRYGIGSNLVIISLDEAERLSNDLRFDFSDYKQRQKIMGAFSCIVFIIIDKEDDFLIIYYRDIRLPTEVYLDQVKKLTGGKGDSNAIAEQLRALSANRTPSIL